MVQLVNCLLCKHENMNESNPQPSHEKVGLAALCLESWGCKGGGRMPGTCWSVSLSRWVSSRISKDPLSKIKVEMN